MKHATRPGASLARLRGARTLLASGGQIRKAKTVAELCDAYWADAEAGKLMTRRRAPKKASTLVTDRGRIERHIKPLLAQLKAIYRPARALDFRRR